MITVRIIPCLDVKFGKVVKGTQFQKLRLVGSIVELAIRYEREGADELILLDISATPETRSNRLEIVREVRECLSIPLTVGGGVRSVEDAGALLEAGADKVTLNTAAFRRPKLLSEIAETFGRQCAVLALDAARSKNGEGWEVVTLSGATRTGYDACHWASEAAELGAGEILLTSWDKDGSQSGYDVELLQAITQVTSIPVIASGGAAKPEDFFEALDAGADALLAASIFHYRLRTIAEVKRYLSNAGKEMRL